MTSERTPKTSKPTYSVVIPVYGNAQSLPEVIQRLDLLNAKFNGALEAVFVVDGSTDNSFEILSRELPLAKFSSRLISHSRNFGAFAAIRTGFNAAKGDYVAAMAADLQEPFELLTSFFELLSTGKWDIAVGVREARVDPGASKIMSKAYWGMYRKFVQPEMPSGGVDIFATTKEVAQRVMSMSESNSSLVGLLMWVGYRRVSVPYSRQERKHGKSAWSFKKKFKYLMDSVFSFTSLPISAILIVGFLGTIITFVIALAVLISWMMGGIGVPGYAAQMLVQLFSTGSILFALGILGTYIWRTYENSKMRPQSIVMTDDEF